MDKKRLIGALILTAVLVFIGIVIPLTLGLGTGSLSEQEISNQIDFYQKFYWSLFIIWGVLLAFMFIKNNNKYGDGIGFFNIGENPSYPFFKRFTPMQITLLSSIFFSTIFLIANYLQFGGFTGLRVLPQQFSKAQSLLFSTLLIPTSENLLFAGILALFSLGLTLFAIKYKIDVTEYKTYLYIGAFMIGGIFAVIWHSTAYPSNDLAKIVVFTFWGLGAVISLATGFFIPFLILHMLNNFFIDFSRLYSSDILLYTMIMFIVGMIALYYYLYRGNIFGKGQKAKEILE